MSLSPHPMIKQQSDPPTLESMLPTKRTTTRATITVQNIIAHCELNCALDLHFLARIMRNIEYFPQRYAPAVFRLKKPSITVLIFNTGKLIISGAKNEYTTRIVSRQVARMIQRYGHPSVTYSNFKVYNIHCTFNFGSALNLSTFTKLIMESRIGTVEQHSENIPGCVYRPTSDAILFIFEHGKIILKATNRDTIFQALKVTYPLLLKSRIGI